MGIIAWLALGLLAGLAAQYLMPGKVQGGILVTIAVGIVGALVGGFLGGHLLGLGDVTGFDVRSILLAVGGAVLVLFLYGKFKR